MAVGDPDCSPPACKHCGSIEGLLAVSELCAAPGRARRGRGRGAVVLVARRAPTIRE